MFSLKEESKKTKLILYTIMFIFFIIGTYTVIKYGDNYLLGNFNEWNNDDVKYVRSAWTLLDNGKFTYHNVNDETVFIMPGLPYTMAFFMSIFGKFGGITAFRIFQVVLMSLSFSLIFFIGRFLFNSKVGIISSILSILYLPNLFTPNLLLTEVIFYFLILLLVYTTLVAIKSREIKHYIIGGIVWGIAALFRPTVGAYPIVVLILWIYNNYKFKDILKFTIIVSSVFCLVMSPWWIRNYKEFHRFIPFTLSSGNPMIQGSYINYDTTIDFHPWETTDDVIKQEEYYKDNLVYRFKNYILKKPLTYAKWYLIDKTVILWISPFYWKPVYNIHIVFVGIYHLLLLTLGFIGMYSIHKKSKNNKVDKTARILFWLFIYYSVVHIPYITFNRYSYPMIWIFVISSAFVINNIITQKQERSKQILNTNNLE